MQSPLASIFVIWWATTASDPPDKTQAQV